MYSCCIYLLPTAFASRDQFYSVFIVLILLFSTFRIIYGILRWTVTSIRWMKDFKSFRVFPWNSKYILPEIVNTYKHFHYFFTTNDKIKWIARNKLHWHFKINLIIHFTINFKTRFFLLTKILFQFVAEIFMKLRLQMIYKEARESVIYFSFCFNKIYPL